MIRFQHIKTLLGEYIKPEPILERPDVSKKFTLNEYAKKLGVECSKSLINTFKKAVENKEIEVCGTKKGINGVELKLYRFKD